MNAVAQVLATLTGLTLISVGVLEAFFYRSQRFHSMFLIRRADYDAVRLWVINVGFYNIVFGLGAVIGVILINAVDATAGAALVYFVCASHVVLGLVLLVTERRLWGNAVGQISLPLLTIVIALAFR